MKPQRKRIYALVAIFSLLLSLAPFNSERLFMKNAQAQDRDITLEGNIRWTPSDNPGEFRYDRYMIIGDLTIEAGTHLKLFDSKITIYGDLFIVGEEGNPVVVEGLADNSNRNYTISAMGGSEIDVNHAVFRGGGGIDESCMSQAPGILNMALAQTDCMLGALNVEAEEVVIKNSIFDHNFRGIKYFGGGDGSQLKNNIFHHNEELALYSEADYELDARDNCWMRPSGPTHTANPDGKGEKIEGEIDFFDWQECGTDHKPVLIIPGIGGSWNWDVLFGDVFTDKWDFPPTDHTYESLIESFEGKGYQKGKDLQIVFYDWRKGNHESAENFLAPAIENLKEISFDEKYDIVAHSMGGIVLMDYIKNHSNQIFDKKIFLGTPLAGSAKAYPVWEGGIIPADWEVFELYLWYQWFGHGGSNFDLVREFTPSVKQLLPIYDYTIPDEATEPVYYNEMREYNQYLDDLFWNTYNAGYLFSSENTLIIEGAGIPTSKMIDVKEYHGEDEEKLWKDGQPIHNPLMKDETQGDGTVVNNDVSVDIDPDYPLFSCESDKLPGIKHIQLPTAAISEIHNFLFGEPPVQGDYPLPSEDKIIFAFASPVDVKIIAPDGGYITKNENSIGDEKAFYYSDGQEDGAKIVEIQEPQNGEYKIELTGNGNGEFHILASRQNGENFGDDEVQGQVTTGQKMNFSIDTNAEEPEIQPGQAQDTTSPTISITSPEDQKEYLNDQYALPVGYSITDETTLSENITKNIRLDSQPFSENKIDLSLEKLGKHALEIIATDEAGNKSEKKVAFQITTNLEAIRNNFNHYFDLGLVKKKVAKKYFGLRLKNLKNLFEILEKTENSKLKPKLKEASVKMIKKIIDADIDLLVRQIKRKSPNWIDKKAADILTQDLEFTRL